MSECLKLKSGLKFGLKFGMTVAAATLAKWTSVDGGPPFNRFNSRPLYPINFLDKWAEAKLGPVFRNTSQADDGAQHAGGVRSQMGCQEVCCASPQSACICG